MNDSCVFESHDVRVSGTLAGFVTFRPCTTIRNVHADLLSVPHGGIRTSGDQECPTWRLDGAFPVCPRYISPWEGSGDERRYQESTRWSYRCGERYAQSGDPVFHINSYLDYKRHLTGANRAELRLRLSRERLLLLVLLWLHVQLSQWRRVQP